MATGSQRDSSVLENKFKLEMIHKSLKWLKLAIKHESSSSIDKAVLSYQAAMTI